MALNISDKYIKGWHPRKQADGSTKWYEYKAVQLQADAYYVFSEAKNKTDMTYSEYVKYLVQLDKNKNEKR
jgi:hypothetical protein